MAHGRFFIAVTSCIALILGGPLTGAGQAQTLNQGLAAMEQGDFFAAFSALRGLERAGDPEARRLLNELFLTPDSAEPRGAEPPATPVPPVSPVPAAAPARSAPVVRQAPSRAPAASLRPPQRSMLSAGLAASVAPPPMHELPAALTDASFRSVDTQLADIGHLLFFDPILSGNQDVSCAVCHHPSLGSGDGVSLGLGTGARGLGEQRVPVGDFAASQRIPRNAPGLWNLGAQEIRVLFHDGRLEADPARPGSLLTPQGPLDYLGLGSILAAQALFPVLSAEEMAGRPEENPVAAAVHDERIQGDDGAWAILAARVDAIPAYRAAFAAWRGVDKPVTISEIANAIAAFIEDEFRADQSPFDAYLRETAALSAQAGEGMRLFFGRANCASCHAGSLLTDQQFHAMGQPPIGPGKLRDANGYSQDIGRAAVTLDAADAFAFRTPMLRNVLQTGPWGHAGAFSDIRDFLRHHLNPVAGLAQYQPQAVLPDLTVAPDDYEPVANAELIARISEAAMRSMLQRPLVMLQEDEIDLLVAFLEALTDPQSLADLRPVPQTVPSGLRVER